MKTSVWIKCYRDRIRIRELLNAILEPLPLNRVVFCRHFRLQMTQENGSPQVTWTMTRSMWQATTQVAPMARPPGVPSEVENDLHQGPSICRSSVKTTCEPEHSSSCCSPISYGFSCQRVPLPPAPVYCLSILAQIVNI